MRHLAEPPPRGWAFDGPLAWAGLVALALVVVASVAVLDALTPHLDAVVVARSQGRAAREAMGWQPVGQVGNDEPSVELLVASRNFSFDAASGRVEGAAAQGPRAELTRRVVEAELARYPRRFLRRSGLERVLLCERLLQENRRIPSLPNVESTLLLEVDDDEVYLRRLVHHEVFHFFDYADDGMLKPDPPWEALNLPGFRYGDGGRTLRLPGASALDPPAPGFVSLYATSGVEEDKAELFSFLMVSPERIEALARVDAILEAKRQQLRQRLAARDASLF